MTEIVILEFVNLFCAGLWAGAEFAVCFGVRPAVNILDEQPHLQLRQKLILILRVLVPAIFLPTLLSAIAITYLNGTGSGFVWRCIGLLAIIIWGLVTFLGTVPINSDILTWRADSPPSDWRAVISRWERLDKVRFWTAVAAFAFFLAATALQLTENALRL